MPLTDENKKKIDDLVIGESVTKRMNIHDQLAAMRKQILANAAKSNTPLVAEFQALEDLVAAEKAKKVK